MNEKISPQLSYSSIIIVAGADIFCQPQSLVNYNLYQFIELTQKGFYDNEQKIPGSMLNKDVEKFQKFCSGVKQRILNEKAENSVDVKSVVNDNNIARYTDLSQNLQQQPPMTELKQNIQIQEPEVQKTNFVEKIGQNKSNGIQNILNKGQNSSQQEAEIKKQESREGQESELS